MQYLDTKFGNFPGSDMWNAKNPLSEDCLYLNVWVPEAAVKDGKPRPVMVSPYFILLLCTSLYFFQVWIYGGGFYGGSNELWVYDGKALAAYGDVIVASMNYRVGSFGFLSTGDERIQGNFGLKDQQVALQWIKRNAEGFGGNPEEITLFGESAGAASIGYHMLANSSADLFQQAIMQSGSPDSHWSYMTLDDARARSSILFDNIGCPNDAAILQCLQEKPAQEIFENEWVVENFLQFPWVPTEDGTFLVASPKRLLEQGRVQNKDVLLGANKDEGTFWILYSLPGLSKDGPSPLTQTQFKNGVDIVDWDLSSVQRDDVVTFYQPPDVDDGEANTAALDDIAGDRAFTCPTLDFAATMSSKAKTFVYYLTHRASNEVWPDWMGVIHGAEIQVPNY
jgi:carboxylesterase type B